MASKGSEIGKAHLLGQFSKNFYERFFPTMVQKEMEEQFMLQQRNWIVDE